MTARELIPYLVGPVICGLIGWVTNWLAVKMLFHPRLPLRIGPLTIQGVFPKRQEALAARLGALIERELVNMEEIADALRQQDLAARFRGTIEQEVERILTERLVQAVPMAGMFLTGAVLDKVKNIIVPEIEKLIPLFVDKAAAELTACYDVECVVREKVAAFPVEKLEEILFAIMRSEFRFIELTGGVLGFLIGAVQSLGLWLLR
ncbi:protein of unknown function DUF445 [Desulfovibrio sp. X2]|uniref:DUF445 domain-containing protein n=1 Tax=Desulfovibrio sp. X2 TaxID=941449 RepID=UPI000358E49A|nr:DUF445 family protein [Desulfovibrio sp. X2]EPR37545.1 protein of unknown function DUF445 [Desulfovibrio sp. X2]